MALTNAAIDRRVDQFQKDVNRAHDLYARLVDRGYSVEDDSEYATPLRQPDRRDAGQFIFFEVAAKYEAVARDLFRIEVRLRLTDSQQRAEFIMGSVDRGLQGVMGWGSPKQLSDRARNLFGKTGFFARLESHVGTTTYQRLSLAHKVRNHIAHSGTAAYQKALAALRVPKKSRRGCGPGRVLVDYPSTVSKDDRWFHRFIAAYESLTCEAKESLRVG